MKTLPLVLDIPAMQKKVNCLNESSRFDSLKQLLILRIQGCLAISHIIEVCKKLPKFSNEFICWKIENSFTESQLFGVCKTIREMRTLDLIALSLEDLEKISNKQLEKIYHKQFK